MMAGQDVYSGLIDRGFGPVQAAVLSGNAQQESSFDPTAWNAESGAGGLMQWRGPRLQGLLNFAASNGTSPADLGTQMDYIKAEMNGPESANSKAFLSATDIPTANAALKQYLRYGPSEGGNRLQYSQAFAGQKGSAPMAGGTDLDAILGPANGSVASTPAAGDSSSALDSILGALPGSNVAVPPANLQRGSKEYAQWAVQQAKAGKTLPQVSPTPPKANTPGSDTSLPAQISAGFTSAVNALPIVGPTAMGGLEAAKGAVYGVPADQIHQEDQANQAANPLASGIGNVTGTVLPFMLAPESALLGTSSEASLPIIGNLGARILGGGLSSATIEGADTALRGGSPEDVTRNALTAGAIGAAFPVVAKGLGAAWQAFKGPSAEKTLANALTADQIVPGNVANMLTQTGPGSMVADLGPNAQQLAGSLASLPGEPQTILKTALTNRAAQTGNRLTGDIANTLGTGGSVQQQIANLSAAQSAAAKPLYDAVRDVQVQPTPAIDFIRNSPLGKAAFDQGANMAANDGYSASGLTVGTVDYAKQALDDIISSAQRAGNNNLARQATQMANSLKSETDAQVPLYAAARDAYAGPAKVKDAIELGRSVFTKDVSPEDLQSTIAGMSNSERDGLLLGAQSAVQNLMGNAKSDAQAVKSLFASNFNQQKLAQLIGPDAAQDVSNAIDREGTFAGTKNVVMGNSLTAARQAGQRAVAPETMGIPSSKSATWTGLALAGLEKARGALTGAYRNAQNVRLANMLTQGGFSPATASRVAAASGPTSALLAPAAAPAALSLLPQNDNALVPLPHRPVQITVNGGNRLLAPAQ